MYKNALERGTGELIGVVMYPSQMIYSVPTYMLYSVYSVLRILCTPYNNDDMYMYIQYVRKTVLAPHLRNRRPLYITCWICSSMYFFFRVIKIPITDIVLDQQ